MELGEQERNSLIQTFREITHTPEDDDMAQRMLEMHQWNLERAINAFMAGDFNPPADSTQNQSSSGGQTSPYGGSTHRIDRNQANISVLDEPQNSEPVTPAPGSSLLSRPVGLISSILGTLLSPLDYLVGATPAPSTSQEAVQRFVDQFTHEFSTEHCPNFVVEGFQATVGQAIRQEQLMLCYLHSPLHQDTPEFCREVLCSQEVTSSVNESVVVWGASVAHAEGMRVADLLQATSYPFLALLLPRPNSQVQLVEKFEGKMTGSTLVDKLMRALAQHAAVLEREAAQRRQREEEARLRQEQDAEYHATLQADRLRQAELQAERERKAKEEEEERQREEMEKALEISRKLNKEATLKQKKDNLSPEPPQGPDTTRLRLQFPNGAKVDRRFLNSDSLQVVRDYIDIHFGENDIEIENYSISTNYPKRTFEDSQQSLLDSGLHPQAVLYIQDLDA
mmetsp:Transcript_8129/g.10771  ORF Transcript_8129/g.10771 Transcript_8129/m.10771 type:complete len:452 (+) Transcript_8129:91-1446(+)